MAISLTHFSFCYSIRFCTRIFLRVRSSRGKRINYKEVRNCRLTMHGVAFEVEKRIMSHFLLGEMMHFASEISVESFSYAVCFVMR